MTPLITLLTFVMTLWMNRRREPSAPWIALRFMYGRWRTDLVKTAHIWREAEGECACDILAYDDSRVLIRRNRGLRLDDRGQARPVFDQVLRLFYKDGGLRADYVVDGQVLHFTDAAIIGGERVVFTTAPRPTGPTFRLSYARVDDQTLASELSLAAPDGREFHTVLAEALTRRR